MLGECLGRKALLPGRDYLHQIRITVALLGKPADDDMGWVGNAQALEYVSQLPDSDGPPPPLSEVLPSASPASLDLLSQLLEWHPKRRLSAARALEHDWFAPLRENEATAASPAEVRPPFNFGPEELKEPGTTAACEWALWGMVRALHERRVAQAEPGEPLTVT